MAELPVGVKLLTDSGQQLEVIKKLGAGGQGTVYQVSVGGNMMALKWYHETAIRDKKAFYENLQNNIMKGSPAPCFLWPKDTVRSEEYKSFGYVMELRPAGYVDMSRFLLRQQFGSFKARINAMVNMVHGFRLLHNQGFSYQDLNDGNFFIDPNSGDVLICDNDNVSTAGYSTGILGKSRYMAPEIVLGQKMPDKATDRYSLALLLFELCCKAHPLEGAGGLPPCLTPSLQRQIYGSNPVFMFDPKDDSNRPVRGIHNTAIAMWPQLPEDVRNLFIRAFSKEAMTYHPQDHTYAGARPIEKEWLEVLLQLRNSIVPCSCGEENMVTSANCQCSSCKKALPVAAFMKTLHHNVPIYPGAEVTCMELFTCSDDEAIVPAAKVLRSKLNPTDPHSYGIRNVSSYNWDCTTTKGVHKNIAPGDAMPARPGIQAVIKNGKFEII